MLKLAPIFAKLTLTLWLLILRLDHGGPWGPHSGMFSSFWNLNLARSLRAAVALTFLLLTAVSSAHAQYSIDTWTAENGLPQNTARAILQTRDGYLWLGTQDGLVRFDGVRFVTFNTTNTKGISSNRITCLFEDALGALWVGTEDGGVIKYKDRVFTTYSTDAGLPNSYVHGVAQNSSGHVLVQTSSGVVTEQNGKFVRGSNFVGLLPGGVIYLGPSGTVWAYERGNIRRIKDDKESTYTHQPDDIKLPAILTEDSHGALWIGTADGKLRSFHDNQMTEHALSKEVAGTQITALHEDPEGNIWIGTATGTLCRYRDERIIVVAHEEITQDHSVMSINQDHEGTVWFGTVNQGLSRVNKIAISVIALGDGLTGNGVYPIFQDREGTIWAGSIGLLKINGDKFVRYSKEEGLHFYGVMSLEEDRDGRLWIGSVGGLSYFKDGNFTSQDTLFGFLPNTYTVWAILQASNGDIWFGTERGLVKYHDSHITIYTEKDGLPSDDIKEIHQDKKGNLWFGTYGGLVRLDGDKFVTYTENDGLASNRVRCIYEESDGTFWIGTYDGGLSRLKDGKFTRYRTEDGLYNNGVFQILEDSRGNFWMGCNRGIYRVSKQELNDFADGKAKSIASLAFGKRDGLLNVECNGGRQPSGLKTPDGKLWFPTQGGIAVIDPNAVPYNQKAPPVLVEAVSLEHESLPLDSTITIPPGKSNLEITYTGLSLTKSDQVRFKYKLLGLDNDWIDLGTRRTVYFSHLPPGQYTLVLAAANSDGVWNEQGATLKLDVIPAFWQTWSFIIFLILLASALVFLFYRWRVKQLRRAHATQVAFSRQLIESQEGERKRIAAELHDSLGQNLLVIKNWSLLAINQVDSEIDRIELREQLGEISTTATESLQEVRTIAHNLRPYQLDDIGLTKVLKAMVNKVTLSSGIEITSDIDLIDDLPSAELQINLYRIVQEALNNIVKHSGATAAKISIKREEKNLLVNIEDNGSGFDKDQKSTNGNGFGIAGISERARIIGGAFSLRSSPGRGTSITVTINSPDKK